jgi:phospholipid/cholesterol/gamma-HCH transport system substrate-binding protein
MSLLRPNRRTVRELRSQLRTMLLMVALAIFGLAVGSYVVVHQRIVWPSWVPFVGEHQFVLSAQVSAVAGVLPGQGQAVTISGIDVGQISGLTLRGGTPLLTMSIDSQYSNRIYPNATVLLRPKTGLNDMVAELDPGTRSAGPRLHSGATLNAAQTLPTVSLDEVLAQLDSDTRDELMLLISNAGQALARGGGGHLADVLRRFDPLSRDVELATHLVAQRSVELTRLMGNLGSLATELGNRETQLTAFVQGNEGVFRAFAQQDRALQQTIELLPPALRAGNTALVNATTLGKTLGPTLAELDPSARALRPTLADLQPFFDQTTPVLRDQLRPFSIAAQPTARLLAPATHKLAAATPGLQTLAGELDNIVNELAYKSKANQSYLFYLPWANHDTNSVLANQDGVGPVRRSLLVFTCGTLQLLQDLADPKHNPTLATLIQLLNTPGFTAHCTAGGLPK